MRNPPEGMMNLTLFARALSKAEHAYLSLETEEDPGALQLRLEAVAASSEEAEELHRLLAGLNSFAAAAADAGRGDAGPSDWGRVLRSVVLERSGSNVEGAWLLDAALLRKWADTD
jgi:hypothetical protein